MRILLTNDDGIYSQGLWALVEALRPLGQVLVVAPDREQSGVGAAVTLHAPIRATEVLPQVEDVRAWAVEGTPADSVILALEHLVEGPVDLVMAGINQGANLGDDILVSGTAGSALQAYFRGISAIAVSVTALHNVHLEAAARIGRALAQRALEDSLPRPVLLNVNLPNLPLEQIQGVEVTRMGKRSYMDTVQVGEDGKRTWYWIRRNRPQWQMLQGTDIYAVRHSRISITPLNSDLTLTASLDPLASLAVELTRALKLG